MKCWKCGYPIADGDDDGMVYTSDPPCFAHRECREKDKDASIAALESQLTTKDAEITALKQRESFARGNVGIHWAEERDALIAEIARLKDECGDLEDMLTDDVAAAYEQGAREFAEWEERERDFGESSTETVVRFLASRGTGLAGEGKKEGGE